MSFLDSFKIAQQNLACNRSNGGGARFDTRAFPCSAANPLMDVLIAGEPARLPVNFFQANPFVHSSRAMVRDGSSTFHALELEARRRFQSGFSIQANYTYGKAISDFDGDDNTLINDVRPSFIRFKNSTRGEFIPRQLFKAN